MVWDIITASKWGFRVLFTFKLRCEKLRTESCDDANFLYWQHRRLLSSRPRVVMIPTLWSLVVTMNTQSCQCFFHWKRRGCRYDNLQCPTALAALQAFRRLSGPQPPVPPVLPKLVSWKFSVFRGLTLCKGWNILLLFHLVLAWSCCQWNNPDWCG